MGILASAGLTATQVENAVWDALTANHVTASTTGLTQRQLRDAAISGQTAASVMSKLVGMTNGQAVATSGGMVISSFDNSDFSMTASQTVDIIPATGESDLGMIVVRTLIGTTDVFRVSADSGTNYSEPALVKIVAGLGAGYATVGDWADIRGIGNSTGRYRIVTSATAGTRNFTRTVTTFT